MAAWRTNSLSVLFLDRAALSTAVPEVGGGIQRSDDVVRVEGITGTYVDLGGIAQMLDDL
jgi:hypothetical protein